MTYPIIAHQSINTTNVVYCNMLVADSSTLILLAKSGLLDIFLDNLERALMIPKAVENECTCKMEYFDAKLISQRIKEEQIKVYSISQCEMCTKLIVDFNIALGEAEALTLCHEKKGLLLTDDKKAINACKILHLPFATALDVLIRAYQRKLIDGEQVNLILERLIFYGRYSKEITDDAKERLEGE